MVHGMLEDELDTGDYTDNDEIYESDHNTDSELSFEKGDNPQLAFVEENTQDISIEEDVNQLLHADRQDNNLRLVYERMTNALYQVKHGTIWFHTNMDTLQSHVILQEPECVKVHHLLDVVRH